MKTMCRFVAITVLLSVTALIPTTLIAEDGLVSFPDANLEAAVRQAIEKPTGDIHKSDLNGLTNLVANSLGITYIHGLEHCTSLTYLSLWENQINDLYPLAYLSNLRRLNLGNNNITDISRLSYLNGLRQLWLTHNQIINISPLSNLTNLTLLDLSENQITDISPLSNL